MTIEQIKNKLKLQYFLYEIVHHCNLNCKGCDHCSPIADEEYVNIKQFKDDLKKLKKYFNIINAFAIMGGEPLLHPNITEIIKISRKILNKTIIIIYTNGIELEKQPKEFWEICKKNNVEIIITKYKININLETIFALSEKYKVKVFIEKNREKEFFHKIKFNTEGNEILNEKHRNCFHGDVCHQLENGILYKCPIIPAARHFNTFFNKNMIISEEDGLNLNKKLKKEEIIEYFNNPIPFCKYCNMEDREENKEWGLSKKDIAEWT